MFSIVAFQILFFDVLSSTMLMLLKHILDHGQSHRIPYIRNVSCNFKEIGGGLALKVPFLNTNTVVVSPKQLHIICRCWVQIKNCI